MCETYTTGGDTLFDLKTPIQIGQTFSPLVTHTLEFIDLNLKRATPGDSLRITLHDLATDPDMISAGITNSSGVTWPPRMWTDISRVRFKMRPKKLQVGKAYGILLHCTPDPGWNPIEAQYDAAGATYPRGQRFTKATWKAPPTYYPGSDLIFAEFGTPVAPPKPPKPPPKPPPVPPDPPILNWLLIKWDQDRTVTGEKITAYTNAPCHLWMRWSLIYPKIHRIARKRRGIIIRTDLYFCFDVYEDNEQVELGDTLTHTFMKEPWPYCEERWWYFHGEVNNIPSKSTSAIFYKHPLAPIPVVACEAPTVTDIGGLISTYWRDSYHFRPTASYSTNLLSVWCCCWLGGWLPPPQIEIALWNARADGMPIGDPITAPIIDVLFPPYPNVVKFTANISGLTLLAGNNYAISVGGHPLYPPNPPRNFRWCWNATDTCVATTIRYRQSYSAAGWSTWVTLHGGIICAYQIPQKL